MIKTKYNIVIAKHWWEKLRGLYFRPKNTLIFIFKCNDIHTMFFWRNIDVAFLDEDGKVVDIRRNLKPWNRVYDSNACIVMERFASDDYWPCLGEQVINRGGEHESVSCM